MKSKINIFLIVFITYSMVFFNNCNKDPGNGYYDIPYVYVNKTVNLTLPSYQSLTIPGNYIYLPYEGYKGIVLFHAIDNTYLAFERACPYKPMDTCSIICMDLSNTYLKCGHYEGTTWVACCGSKFDLDGNILTNPAQYPLKRYQVIQEGSILTIIN